MKENLKSFLKRNFIFVLSFFIPFIVMLIIFIARGIYPFGDESFLHIDMYHQYYPFLKEFYRIIKEGGSLLYSWNTGIGSNFLALFVYYLSSPLNWLALVFPENLLIEYMSYLVVIKIGLSGFTFSYYLSKHFNTKNFGIVFFSIAYAMSGYFGAYNWNVMWIDCLVLTPLIILGLELLVNDGKPGLYCVTLGLCIFTNYYLSIMICIYLVLYFFVLLVSAKKKVKACLRFGIYSLISGGMAAILLLPELEMLLLTEFSSSTFPSTFKFYFSVFECFARHFIDVTVETGLDHWPNIYCGIAIFFFLPLYLLCKKIPLKERIAKFILLVFMVISFCVNVLSFIWHGMNYPDSLPSRQSFLYILLILTVCFEAFLYLKEYSTKKIIAVFVLAGVFIISSIFIINNEAFAPETFIISGCALIVYAAAIILYRTGKFFTLKTLTFLVLAAVIIETTANMLLTSVPTVTRSCYLKNTDSFETLVNECKENDNAFYRIEKFERLTQNDAMIAGFHSATLFSSTSNSLVNQFYEKYGMKTSKVFYEYEGSTPLMAALLNVKYMMSEEKREPESLYSLLDQEGEIYLYKNNYSLSFGYIIPTERNKYMALKEAQTFDNPLENALNSNDKTLNPIEEQNKLAINLGSNGTLFNKFSVFEDTTGTTITVPESGYIYAYVNNSSVNTLTLANKLDGENEFSKLNNPYIIDLGWHSAGTILKLTSEDTESTLQVEAYRLDENKLSTLINKLNTQTMNVTSYNSTNITGTINVNTAGEFVMSVPFENGWSLYVDGKETDIDIYENTFISTYLDEGEHTIELCFTSKSLKYGTIISLASILIFLLMMYLRKRIKSREIIELN